MRVTADSTIHPGARRPIVAATSALLSWEHRRGGTAHCLVRLRTLDGRDQAVGGALETLAVVSELRDNPPGRGILSDFGGVAEAVLAQLVPPASPPDAVTWYAHHGEFSTYDDAGPETLTRVDLRREGRRYVDDVRGHHLLGWEEAAELAQLLRLEPVDQVLEAWSWVGITPPPLLPPRAGGL